MNECTSRGRNLAQPPQRRFSWTDVANIVVKLIVSDINVLFQRFRKHTSLQMGVCTVIFTMTIRRLPRKVLLFFEEFLLYDVLLGAVVFGIGITIYSAIRYQRLVWKKRQLRLASQKKQSQEESVQAEIQAAADSSKPCDSEVIGAKTSGGRCSDISTNCSILDISSLSIVSLESSRDDLNVQDLGVELSDKQAAQQDTTILRDELDEAAAEKNKGSTAAPEDAEIGENGSNINSTTENTTEDMSQKETVTNGFVNSSPVFFRPPPGLELASLIPVSTATAVPVETRHRDCIYAAAMSLVEHGTGEFKHLNNIFSRRDNAWLVPSCVSLMIWEWILKRLQKAPRKSQGPSTFPDIDKMCNAMRSMCEMSELDRAETFLQIASVSHWELHIHLIWTWVEFAAVAGQTVRCEKWIRRAANLKQQSKAKHKLHYQVTLAQGYAVALAGFSMQPDLKEAELWASYAAQAAPNKWAVGGYIHDSLIIVAAKVQALESADHWFSRKQVECLNDAAKDLENTDKLWAEYHNHKDLDHFVNVKSLAYNQILAMAFQRGMDCLDLWFQRLTTDGFVASPTLFLQSVQTSAENDDFDGARMWILREIDSKGSLGTTGFNVLLSHVLQCSALTERAVRVERLMTDMAEKSVDPDITTNSLFLQFCGASLFRGGTPLECLGAAPQQVPDLSVLAAACLDAGLHDKAHNLMSLAFARGYMLSAYVAFRICSAQLHDDYAQVYCIMGQLASTKLLVYDLAIARNLIEFSGNIGDMHGVKLWFQQMALHGVPPDRSTFHKVIEICAKRGDSIGGEAWLKSMISFGMHPDTTSLNYVVCAWANAGCAEKAETWLQYMERSAGKAVVMTDKGEKETIQLDRHLYSSVAYCFVRTKAGTWKTVEKLFTNMEARGMCLDDLGLIILLLAYGMGAPKQTEKALAAFKAYVEQGGTPSTSTICCFYDVVGNDVANNVTRMLGISAMSPNVLAASNVHSDMLGEFVHSGFGPVHKNLFTACRTGVS